MKTKHILIIIPIIAVSLQACSSLMDYLSDYKGSLWSPTVGDMIYLESANDTYMFGKPGGAPEVGTTLTYNFLISRYEVSYKAFDDFVQDGGYNNQVYWTTAGWNFIAANQIKWPRWHMDTVTSQLQPVVGLSWYEAVAFTQWLSIKEGFPPAYNANGQIIDLLGDGYRLPTEAEWEYAASKGDPSETERLYAWGNNWVCNKAVCRTPGCDVYVSYLEPIGGKSPAGDTPQGLSDITGNASEMVSDTYDGDVSQFPSTDRYIFDTQENYIVHRGGGWRGQVAGVFETSRRDYVNIQNRSHDDIGFRVVRTYPIQ